MLPALFSFNFHFFASIDKVIKISWGTCANLKIIAVFDDTEMFTSSSESVAVH
jgi:hypothetical protein